MKHNTSSISERNGLTNAGCRAPNAKILCGPFFFTIVVFIIMPITLSVQGAQESPQIVKEWLSSESWGISLSSRNLHVVKRQAEVNQKSTDSGKISPRTEKISKEVSAVDAVKTDTVTENSEPGSVHTPVTDSVKLENEQTPKDDDENKAQSAGEDHTDKTGTEPSDDHKPVPAPKGISSEAVLRGFYVFVGVGTIVLLYIVIKLLRLRRRRATRKYRVLSHNDDQEMFPLAADDGDDEEIYNAADHQTLT
ncbi:uncharacterized protein [Panulirus ornatus]|uniref:uncharacterized protein n=1 Tax=Panulirus ornatus TaxID=150431 RepID=UPI003A86B1B3